MRIAVLIVGLVLGAIIFFQSLVAAADSGLTHSDATRYAVDAIWVLELCWLIACGLVLFHPRVSMALFVFAGIVVFATPTGNYKDAHYWAGMSLVLAAASYVGYRGKRKEDRRKAKSQADRDELLTRLRGMSRS